MSEQQRVSVSLPNTTFPGEVFRRVEEEEAKGVRLREVRNEKEKMNLVFTAVTPDDENVITLVQSEGALPHGVEDGLDHWGRNIDVFATSVVESGNRYLVFFGKYQERESPGSERERDWSYRIEYRSPSRPKQQFDGWTLLNSHTCDWARSVDDGLRVSFDVYKSATERKPERTLADYDAWQNFGAPPVSDRVELVYRPARWRRALRSILQAVARLSGRSVRRDETLRGIYRRK